MKELSIDNAIKIDDLNLVKYLRDKASPLTRTIELVFDHVQPYLNSRIPFLFPNYTLHDVGHSLRIIQYMEKLIGDYKRLSDLEITLLVVSALVHDIGMAVDQSDLDAIKKDSFEFCETKYSTMFQLLDSDHIEATQEYIRRIHAQLSARHIRRSMADILILSQNSTLDFVEELALICQSHTEGFDWIESNLKTHDVRGDYSFNAQYIACILRIADILDIDGNRTPYKLYKLISPKGKSDREWQQHFVISNNEKIVDNEKTGQKEVVFHGKAKNADIHRKILKYIDWVGDELAGSISICTKMSDKYGIIINEKPQINIQAEGYTFSGYKMTLEFKAISSLLMGEKIYGDKTLGLRELIQNSIDACRIRQERDISEFGEDPYTPKIRVLLDKGSNQAVIKDNGIGMTLDIIKNHFLNIGVSYYKSFDFQLKDLSYKPIGNYGIGFLSCFMLSNVVKVKTRHYESKNRYTIDLEKGNEWTSLTETEDVNFNGTEVYLNYGEFLAPFDNDIEKIAKFLNKFFITDGIDFRLMIKGSNKYDIINSIKNSIADEKALTTIHFSELLSEIDGYAILKNRANFITNIHQLRLKNQVLLFSPPSQLDLESDEYDSDEWKWLTPIDGENVVSIDMLLSENTLLVIDIPIISAGDRQDFLEGMKFTDDDLKEVIEKLENKLGWISILVPAEQQKYISEGELDPKYTFWNDVPFRELVNLGQLADCPTYAFTTEHKLFEGVKNRLYLPFEKVDLYPWSRPSNSNRKDLYIRDVLIKDFYYNFSYTASVFEVMSIVVNIRSRKFIPDISRNNLDKIGTKLINHVIGKAIHKAAAAELSYSEEERQTIERFIKEFYTEYTEFEKPI